MGNTLGGKKTTKIVKMNGETMKFTKQMQAGEITKDYPGHVLLDSESVKHFGIRAKPLELNQELNPKNLYFLVELPKFPQEKGTRRVRSGIQMSAKERLESLMLTRRSVSDLSIMKSSSPSSSSSSPIVVEESGEDLEKNGVRRVKMRLPKAEVEKLMMECKDESEVAERFMELCMANKGGGGGGGGGALGNGRHVSSLQQQQQQQGYCKDDVGMVKSGGLKSREKRVGFMPIGEGEIQLLTAN